MTFSSIIYSIIILPIESFIEFVFCFTLSKFDRFGVAGAIFAVSLAVNFLALPIYNVADEIQLRERRLQQKMSRWVKHIKSAFKGDEQFMMLSAYYHENNYHPLYALRQSLSVLIQIPFFIAAYHFLSHTSLLDGKSIFFLKDLSRPDALLPLPAIGGGIAFSINILPLLMTAINIASSIIYTKDAPLREKIQTFALALIFLFLLYNSSSGLVFYWILNQIFSLCKNIVLKTKNPRRILHGFLNLCVLAASVYLLFFRENKFSPQKCTFYFFSAAFMFAPFAMKSLRKRKTFEYCKSEIAKIFSYVSAQQNLALLLASCIVLWLLCGLVLPSSVIATSPAEFSFLGNTDSPLSYIWSSLAFFCGLFVFWPLVVYKMFGANEKVRCAMPAVFFVLGLCALANAFLFKYDYGIMNSSFVLDNSDFLKNHSFFFTVLPIVFLFITVLLLASFVRIEKIRVLIMMLFSVCATEIFLGTKNVKTIGKVFISYRNERFESEIDFVPDFHLSRTQKNVIVLFLDRAISSFFPYILDQFPEVQTSYDGFVFYPNCLSFAVQTNFASPAMMGGYEYTPNEMNRRDKELLKDKHNDAVLLLPKIFDDAGYDTTIYNVPYIDYDSGKIPPMFDFTNIRTTNWNLVNLYKNNYIKSDSMQDIVCNKAGKYFFVMQILYPPLRNELYNHSEYYYQESDFPCEFFISQYAQLFYLPDDIVFDSVKPTYTFIENELPHAPEILRSPDYTPGVITKEHPAAGNGKSWMPTRKSEKEHYHANVAAHLQVAKFLEFLKGQGVYDNTRIVIVADHAWDIKVGEFEHFKTFGDIGAYANPLLLFKDFNSRGSITRDYSLKTNAETVNLALKDLPVSHKNPFTGKDLKSASDFESFNVYGSGDWRVSNYVGKTQFPMDEMKAYTVRDNIFDERNWTKIDTSEAGK